MEKTEKKELKQITLSINGKQFTESVGPETRLLDLLREQMFMTGTKEGCGVGECGACTVIMDGKTVNSCMVLAGQADGSEIRTVEGLEGEKGELHPLQQAFVETGAIQCGFCTPGMLMSSLALLEANPDPSDDEIKEALSGNICRCTGYIPIIEAVKLAAGHMKKNQK